MKKALLLIILFTINCSLSTLNAQCTAVSIITQPTNQNDSIPGHAHFTVIVAGDAPYNYYWYANGTCVDSTIGTASANNTYNTPPLTMADSNNTYYCIITNCAGADTIISNTVHLICMPVVITIQPLSQTATAGVNDTIYFSVTVSGTPPFTYNWYDTTALVQTTIDTIGHTSIYGFIAHPIVHSMNGWTFGVTITNCRCGLGSSCVGGCTAVSGVATMTVVCPSMGAPVINMGGSLPYCGGNPIYFSTNPVSGAIYNWTLSYGYISHLQNPIDYLASPSISCGTNIIFYLYITLNGCNSPTMSASANVSRVPSITNLPSALTICSGGAISYVPTLSPFCAGDSYVHSSSSCISGFTGTGYGDINDILINTGTTPCTITYTLIPENNFCNGSPVSFSVTVNPKPHITTTSPSICPGDTAHLTASGASTYTWSAGATATGVGTATASPIINTTYTVTGTNTYGCSNTATSTVTVVDTINTAITTSNDTIYANQSGATYQWLNCATGYTPIAGATNQYYVVTANGIYAAAITIGTCVDTTNCTSFQTVSINENGNDGISIYPNPTTGELRIKNAELRIAEVRLYDVPGQCLLACHPELVEGQYTININQFSKGIYFIEVQTATGTARKKIIKQ